MKLNNYLYMLGNCLVVELKITQHKHNKPLDYPLRVNHYQYYLIKINSHKELLIVLELDQHWKIIIILHVCNNPINSYPSITIHSWMIINHTSSTLDENIL